MRMTNIFDCDQTTMSPSNFASHVTFSCKYTKDSRAVGFQMFLISESEPDKLLVAQKINRRTASIEIDDSNYSRYYQVFLIPIFDGTGIVNSDVEFQKSKVKSRTSPNVLGKLIARDMQ